MNKIEEAFAVEDAEEREVVVDEVTRELNSRLLDMGELSQKDKREVEIIDKIRGELGSRKVTYDSLDTEIPEEYLKEYVKVMFAVEQDKMLKDSSHGSDHEQDAALIRRFQQARALDVEVELDSDISHVLGISKRN